LSSVRQGRRILLISEDLDEIRALFDRYRGDVRGAYPRHRLTVARPTVEEIGLIMAGIPMEEAIAPRRGPAAAVSPADDTDEPVPVLIPICTN